MVATLGPPARPLPSGGATTIWRWRTPSESRPWSWCRVYHRSDYSPRGDSARVYGPLARFDPHTCPTTAPGIDPVGRTVLYVAADLPTGACEVFGEAREARLCPAWRVALIRPAAQLSLLDLTRPGSAMAIGALPALAAVVTDRNGRDQDFPLASGLLLDRLTVAVRTRRITVSVVGPADCALCP